MKADTFLDVFGQYMKPELTAPFDGGTVLRLWTEQERRAIGVAVALPAPVEAECIFAAERALAESLCLAHAEIVPHYPAETLNGECLPMLAAFLRRRQKAVNGTFDGASAAWDGTTFRVTLACGGRNILTATHADMMLRDLITEQFGCHALVEFIGGCRTAGPRGGGACRPGRGRGCGRSTEADCSGRTGEASEAGRSGCPAGGRTAGLSEYCAADVRLSDPRGTRADAAAGGGRQRLYGVGRGVPYR